MLARRCLAVLSICFMLRIICIWANVLPRSQYTMECAPKATGFQEVMKRVILLWSAAGLSIFGGHMCGNYFFSGHALMAVIIYYQLSHYMPSNWCIAHKINGLTALTISTLILLAHNHYTLDILGSVIVGSWVFKLYTFIAETKVNIFFSLQKQKYILHRGEAVFSKTCANGYTEAKLCLAKLAPMEYWWTNRLTITDFWRNTWNTTDHKCTETQLIDLFIYK